jgi:hypothetical protein
MKDIRIFLEHRIVNEIKIKCSQTDKEIDPEYVIYDEDSLNSVISLYKQNTEQFNDLSIYFCKQKGNSWIANTNIEYIMDLSRMMDKFMSSCKQSYSYDDILSILNNDNIMIIFIKNTK